MLQPAVRCSYAAVEWINPYLGGDKQPYEVFHLPSADFNDFIAAGIYRPVRAGG